MRTSGLKKRKKKASSMPSVLQERVEKILELPVGTLSNASRIELIGNKRAVVDGCQGIVEYSDELIRLQTESGMVRFTGSQLSISNLTEDSAIIEGNILVLEYLS
ncbi:MAG: YabP/YqfC family sporulation protein [Oscillospiraceae bacterium]|jgi:sporulation protein YqfC|nr:YabP/YqfC family sporulation protein [Oscillospiraceae bacterium]MDD3832379.1 YabP/YqfC family sporulation protein [Oscillospiraceae bacterium]MDD4546802.1 YabP/YqfC family sporulation protein [Oscillospiraceae bacterium]